MEVHRLDVRIAPGPREDRYSAPTFLSPSSRKEIRPSLFYLTLLPGFEYSLDILDTSSARVMRSVARPERNRTLPTPECTGPLHAFHPLDSEFFLVTLAPDSRLYVVPVLSDVGVAALCGQSTVSS